MININLFIIIFILFIIFIGIQLYFYLKKYKINENKLNEIETYENNLKNIEYGIDKKIYTLNDNVLLNLLEDYNNLDIN